MKKTEVLSGMVVLLLACAMSFTSCKKEVESLTVDPISIVLAVGERYQLKAEVLPKKAPQEVEWYTSNPDVVSVDGNGVVTALHFGVCNVKLYAGASSAACQITVVRKKAEHFFTVNANGDKIQFSPGNLQYQASTNKWRFAEHTYDVVGDGGVHEGNVPGSDNLQVSMFYDGWIDQFSWATSGWHDERDSLNLYYYPWDYNFEELPNKTDNRYGFGPSAFMPDVNLTGSSARYDWGVNNPIYNPQTRTTDSAGTWRLLTANERDYLSFYRTTASGVRFSRANVHGVDGMVYFPDDWEMGIHFFKDPNLTSGGFTKNILDDDEWMLCEAEGCVFLPWMGALGYGRYSWQSMWFVFWNKREGDYWTSTVIPEKNSLIHMMFNGPEGRYSCNKASVRLVKMLP
ncbi:MAG: Ig-like domain-containing protein [Bacteroidales bacterium]|nr:Ig-like domain-containing protein [Bacteroidales bacterium]